MPEINEQPRLFLDQEKEIAQAQVTKKRRLAEALFPQGLVDFFKRDTVQKSGKKDEPISLKAAEGTDKGSYPYNPYDTKGKAFDFSAYTTVDLKPKNSELSTVQKEDFSAQADTLKVSENATQVTTTAAEASVDNESIVRQELNKVFAELTQELAKGDEVNYSKLEELIRQYAMLAARNMGISDEEFRKALRKTQKVDQTDNLKAMRGWLSKLGLAAEIVGATLTGALGGLGAGIQSARGLAASATTLENFGKVGQMLQPVNKIIENELNAKKTKYNYQLERLNQLQQQVSENAQGDKSQQQQLKNSIDEEIRNMHQIFGQVAAGT